MNPLRSGGAQPHRKVLWVWVQTDMGKNWVNFT